MAEKEEKNQKLKTKEGPSMEDMKEKLGKTTDGAKIIKLFDDGKLEEKTFERAYKVSQDPNLMKKNSVKQYVKALAQGKFPKRGKLATQLLDSILSGTKSEKARAEELVEDLSQESTGPWSTRTEKERLKELAELREEDLKRETIKETGAAAAAVTGTADIRGKVEKAAEVKRGNWVIEAPPEGVVEKLNGNQRRQYDLIKQGGDIDKKIDELREENMKTREEWINYLRRVLSQRRALKSSSKEMGVADIDQIERFTACMLAEEGLEITINKVFFEREKTDMEEDAPGELKIEYTNENGEIVTSSLQNLLHFIKAYEGYEEISDIDKFNEKFALELACKDLKEGDTFSGRALKDTIKIERIEERDGEYIVVLDEIVTKIPKEGLSHSVHHSLYFDRKQREFSLGEFGSFLVRNGYQRDIADGEMQELVDRASEEELTLEEGEEQNIIYLDKYRERKAKLRQVQNEETGEEEYEVEYEATGTDGRWGMPVIPPHIVGIPKTPPPAKPRIVRKRLNKRNFFQAANKGDIVNAPPEIPEETAGAIPAEAAMEEEVPTTAKPQEIEKGSSEDLDRWKPEFYKEALAYDDIHKVGGMDRAERGFLKDLWVSTRFLSVMDLWEMGKTMWEYYQRRYERRQKERYSSVGKDLPFFSPEMQRINQAAENEQVNQFKESFEQKGVYKIQERLRKTGNPDELKASILTLSEKGQMRWDDIDMWKNLNKFVDPSLAIPIPSNGDPHTIISEKDQRTGFDFLKGAIDSMWGEGTYNEWYNRNKSTFLQNAKSYYEEGKELEGVQGGHARRLEVLLRQHKNGEFVDPHEYEGIILHAIDAGKASMQCKIYYMIEGIAAENQYGRTILSFDRMAHINSEMLMKFPPLEYLCAEVKRPDGGTHRFTIDDYKRWVKWFDEGNRMNTKPGTSVDKFMWKYVLPSNETQTRINKDLRHAENLDHDDMFALLPPASEQILTDACKATTGSKKFLTIEGYANVFPGFSQYMKSLAENDNRSKLVDIIKSYVRFEGIMTNKYEKGKDTYQRMDPRTLSRGTVVTPDTPPKVYIDQTNALIERIIDEYKDDSLRKIYDTMNTEVGDVRFKKNMEQQKYVDQAFEQFGEELARVIKTDGGQKMKDIVEGTNLLGMPFGVSDEEMARRKAEMGVK